MSVLVKKENTRRTVILCAAHMSTPTGTGTDRPLGKTSEHSPAANPQVC